jgi:hypothetical protein
MSSCDTAVVALVALTAAVGCGGSSELTPRERRQADARWEARFGPNVGPGPRAPFALNAEAREDAVDVTVRAHQAGVRFVDSSLGARLFAYKDGQWTEAGNPGPTLPAERVLRRGQTVRVRVEVKDDAPPYRAVVRFLHDRRKVAAAWVDIPPR